MRRSGVQLKTKLRLSKSSIPKDDVLKRVNKTIDESLKKNSDKPCQDFYNFACGNWKKANPIPPKLSYIDPLSKLELRRNEQMRELFTNKEKMAKYRNENVKATKFIIKYYEECMNQKKITNLKSKPVLDMLEKLGGWPMLIGNSWRESEFSLQKALENIYLATGNVFLFDIDVRPHMEVPTKWVPTLDQIDSQLSLPTRETYLDEDKESKRKRKALKKYVKEIAEELNKDLVKNTKSSPKINFESEAEDIVEFETLLAEAIFPVETWNNNLNEQFKEMTLSQTLGKNGLFTFLDGEAFFKAVMPTEMMNSINGNMAIATLVYHKMFEQVNELVKNTQPRKLANYLLWKLVESSFYDLDDRYYDIRLRYWKEVYDIQEKHPLWEKCLREVMYSKAGAVLYVKEYFPGMNREPLQKMMGYMKRAFEEIFEDATWMEQTTKDFAKKKLKVLIENNTVLGFQDFFLTEDIDQFYKYISPEDLNADHTYGSLERILTVNTVHTLFSNIARKLPYVYGNPSEVNGYYTPSKNALAVLAAFLQDPFYEPTFPMVINYAKIGTVLAHEISHAFDSNGRENDENGAMRIGENSWWVGQTEAAYNEREAKVVADYSQFSVPEAGGRKVNGELTKSENIADMNGVKAAWKAYQMNKQDMQEEGPTLRTDYTNDQVFFIAYAQNWCINITEKVAINLLGQDTHAPNRARVNRVLANFPAFGETFNCKRGIDPMYPNQPNVVW